MDLRDDAETDPGQPGFDNNSSEHFLKAQAEKNKKRILALMSEEVYFRLMVVKKTVRVTVLKTLSIKQR